MGPGRILKKGTNRNPYVQADAENLLRLANWKEMAKNNEKGRQFLGNTKA